MDEDVFGGCVDVVVDWSRHVQLLRYFQKFVVEWQEPLSLVEPSSSLRKGGRQGERETGGQRLDEQWLGGQGLGQGQGLG